MARNEGVPIPISETTSRRMFLAASGAAFVGGPIAVASFMDQKRYDINIAKQRSAYENATPPPHSASQVKESREQITKASYRISSNAYGDREKIREIVNDPQQLKAEETVRADEVFHREEDERLRKDGLCVHEAATRKGGSSRQVRSDIHWHPP